MRFDILEIGDFRFPGGTSAAVAHEIGVLHEAGYTVGLVQKRSRVLKRDHPVNPAIAACIAAGEARLVDARTPVEARLALMHNPLAFGAPDPELPPIVADRRILVAHHAPRDVDGVPYYDPATVHRIAEEIVGPGVEWAPISPNSRARLVESLGLPILAEDWTNIVRLEDWPADRAQPVGAFPVIGRHSRADWSKWPATRAELLAAYPDDPGIEVRLLGVGPELERIIGGPLPANWTALPFGSLAPSLFLAGIDFFVYYHHPGLVESFGRTIAEAAASGAVVIVPEHFRATFAEAALYRRPEEVADTVRALHADRETYALQSRLGQRTIDRLYGPGRTLERVRRLIGPPGGAEAATASASTGRSPAATRRLDVDVLQIGDFRTARDVAWRIAHETMIAHGQGHTTGLLHVEAAGAADLEVIHPAIDGLVRSAAAVAVDPASAEVAARLVIVNQPHALFEAVLEGTAPRLPRIGAGRVIAVLDRAAATDTLTRKDALLKAMFGPAVTWAAASDAAAIAIEAAAFCAAEPERWLASVPVLPLDPEPRIEGRIRPVIGRTGPATEADWPTPRAALHAAYPAGEAVVRVQAPRGQLGLAAADVPERFEVLDLHEMDGWRFLGGLDLLVHETGPEPAEVPVNAILWAMANGVPAIVSPAAASALGTGPFVAEASAVRGLIARMMRDRPAFRAQALEIARRVRQRHGPDIHAARLARLVGHRPARPAPRPATRDRILFLSSNGVGLGHLTRLLAVARRMPAPVEPVFATMSQAMPIVAEAGYPVEYLPFHHGNVDVADWNDWFALHLGQIIDFHEAAAIVFDGSNPYSGLIKAAARARLPLVWIRRGMWKETQSNDEQIRRQRFFDLVIEPADIADAVDRGATAALRDATMRVAPIRLLDAEELPQRAEAAGALGLDPARPAVLIQLGAGTNRDIVSIIDAVLGVLALRPEVQPVVAEWLIAPAQLDFWPGVRRLRGFPMSRYYNAFDFTVSAAGYNSFNEIISFGVPAIFIANEHPTMDDQAGRAAFAEANGAGFHLPESRAEEIGPMVEALLDERARLLIRANCARLALDNGAGAAAAAITRLVTGQGMRLSA